MHRPPKNQNRVLRYRMLADGYSTLKSPLAEQYAQAAEALEQLSVKEETSRLQNVSAGTNSDNEPAPAR